MGIFSSFGGLGSYGEFVTTTASTSFGNVGFSSSLCLKAPIDWHHDTAVDLRANCQGTTAISSVMASGMMLDFEFPGGEMDAVHDCYFDIRTDPALVPWEMR